MMDCSIREDNYFVSLKQEIEVYCVKEENLESENSLAERNLNTEIKEIPFKNVDLRQEIPYQSDYNEKYDCKTDNIVSSSPFIAAHDVIQGIDDEISVLGSVDCNSSGNVSLIDEDRISVTNDNSSSNFLYSVNDEEKQFKCNVCMKSFARLCYLKRHAIIHIGERPFICDVCKKSFCRLFNLKDHIRTHTGERPFTCEKCKKSFSQISNLKKHLLKHTGEKPFICNVCKKSFPWANSLKYHILTHTGEKPYFCSICKQSFRHIRTFKNHKLTHNKEKQCDVKTPLPHVRIVKKQIRMHSSDGNQSYLTYVDNHMVVH